MQGATPAKYYSCIDQNLSFNDRDFAALQGIADTMAQLQNEGRLLRGEHNLLGEAFLIMASAAG